MKMSSKEYAQVLASVLKLQIQCIREDSEYEDSELLQGQEIGLMIALEKIKASEFLT